MRRILTAIVLTAVLLAAPAAFAQLRSEVVLSGLSAPVGFVQDPSNPGIQYVVEQGGLIRVVRDGTLLSTPFLDLRSVVLAGGERGLLGLAFPRDYATSGRFYVNFTRAPDGHTVVARFLRASTNPPTANPSSRFDLQWSTGERIIRQPFANHNGGQLAFGPDNYLYIGMGDGGSGNDPMHLAQTPSSLLGKMLRIHVGVALTDPQGFDVPPDNPFLGAPGYAPEIWSIGLRNPWRFSFDDPALGGTGAMLIADVGQNRWEEINHEPAGRGGRNYGWRLREGAHENVVSLPPAFLPLTEPIHEYGHDVGSSITGGFVYRGSALPASFRGRYFFADLGSGRLWSIALVPGPGGEASAADVREHGGELGGGSVLGVVSSFGVDAQGELYIVSYSRGVILRITATPVITPIVNIDVPRNGARLRQPFAISGWAVALGPTTGTGIDALHVWAYPFSGGVPVFVGAGYGAPRPDVGAAFGTRFTPSGFGLRVTGLAPGMHRLVAFSRIAATARFDAVAFVDVAIDGGSLVAIDTPAHLSTVGLPFVTGGWAADPAASTGTGVDLIHVWALPVAPTSGAATFLGAATYGGTRSDVGAFLGTRFAPSAYHLTATLPPGTWDIIVFARSTVSGTFDGAQVARVVVR